MKKTISFKIALKKIGINLTMEVKDLYSENYKTLMKEIEGEANEWKDKMCSWVGKINIVKIPVLPTAKYRCNSNPVKIPMNFFSLNQNKYTPNLYEKTRLERPKTILRKKNKTGTIIFPDFPL